MHFIFSINVITVRKWIVISSTQFSLICKPDSVLISSSFKCVARDNHLKWSTTSFAIRPSNKQQDLMVQDINNLFNSGSNIAFWFNNLYLKQITDYSVYLLVDAVQSNWNILHFYRISDFSDFFPRYSQHLKILLKFIRSFPLFCLMKKWLLGNATMHSSWMLLS